MGPALGNDRALPVRPEQARQNVRYGRRRAACSAGIAGHNLCFDLFGVPTEEEAKAGLDVHGEASSADWQVEADGLEIRCRADFPLCGMGFERRLRLSQGSNVVTVTEEAINRAGVDRPVGWTQHVTLGPPFLEKGKTRFHMPAGASKAFEGEFAPGHDRFPAGAEFQWPYAPRIGGGFEDLRALTDLDVSGAFTVHQMAPGREQAFFTAWSPATKTAFGYLWQRSDFPWLGIWEENGGRAHAPWNGRNSDAWHGVRRLAIPRDAARGARPRQPVRRPDLPLDTRDGPRIRRISDLFDRKRARARSCRMARRRRAGAGTVQSRGLAPKQLSCFAADDDLFVRRQDGDLHPRVVVGDHAVALAAQVRNRIDADA